MKFRPPFLIRFIVFCFLVLLTEEQKAQSSLYMPSATNWVAVGDLDVPGNQLTVEALIYYTGASVNIVSKHTNPGDVNYLLRIGGFEITTTSGYANFSGVSAAGVTISPNKMYHLAATYDGAMLRYYVNGCMTGSMPWTGNMIQSNLITAIGNQSSCACEQFIGYIDEVRIWNVARTQAQIAANMINLPTPTIQPGLLGYWKFDGTMTNLQGNPTYDGVAMGAPLYQQVPLPYPSALFESVTASAPICTGDLNGVINVSAEGYYTPYEYSLDGITYGTTPIFSGLNAGTYTVYTRPQNNNSCVVSSNITITDPPVLSPNLTTTNITCNGANNGTAAIAPSGGDGPTYHQIWSPSLSTTTSLSGLSAGPYSVTVTDTCRASGPELVANGHFEDGNVGFSNGYIYGGAGPDNLAVDVDPSYYNGGFVGTGYGGGGNFLIVDGSTVAGTSFWCESIAVTPNTYYNFSAFVSSMVITSPATVDFQINGISIGTIGAPAATSTWLPFQTVWFSGASTTANLCFYDQSTIGGGNDFGVDNISFKTCGSCTATLPFTITEPAALTLTTTQVNVLCNGGNTGSATVTANGGTLPYTYSWNTVPVQTTATATNLIAGNYSVIVTDNNLCTATISVTITEPPVLTATLSTSTNVNCNGGNDGSATVVAGGGNPGYTYSWNTAPIQTTPTASTIIAGAYTVTVTDLNLCTATANVTITQPTALTIALTSQTNVLCFGGNNGAASISAGGGTVAYSYAWNTVPVQTTTTATNLTAGTYTCVVTDNHFCKDSVTVTITQPAATVTSSITAQTNVLCNGGNTGSATVTAIGGSPAYAYSWNTVPVQTTPTATTLIAGVYTATVTDLNGCTTNATATITQPPTLTLVLASKTNPSCFGTTDASINLTAGGGTGAYTYVWTPNVSTTNSAINIASGSYNITVTDANACTQTITEVVTDPPLLTVNATATPGSFCVGGSSTLNTVVAGGSGTHTYSWSNGSIAASQIVSPITTTIYAVTVTDSLGCTATNNATVTVYIPAVINLGNDTAICSGAILSLNAGAGFLTYVWQNGATGPTFSGSNAGMYYVDATDNNGCHGRDTLNLIVNPLPTVGLPDSVHICPGINTTLSSTPGYTSYLWDTGALTSSITTNTPGMYHVIIQDVNGCVNTDSTKVIVYPVPQLSFNAFPLTGCSPLDVDIINTSVLNGSTIQTWDWQIGTATSNAYSPSITLAAGIYDVALQATTNNGCIVDTLITNYITVNQSPTAIIGAATTEYDLFDDSINLTNQSTFADTYEWYLYNQLLTTQFDLNYPISDTGHFNFQLVALNNFGCTDTTNIIIWVKPSFALYFPNAFTPNGNGNNDRFSPKGYGINTFEMLIFDRWGELVFRSTDLYTGWDGTFHGKDLPQDVYVYKCNIRDSELNPHSYIGGVTLVR